MTARRVAPGGAVRENDKFMLRLPDGMREKLKAEAERNERSMNAEIVARLQETFDLPLGVDPLNPAVQDAMIAKMHEVMGTVVEDMREEQRVASGMPLLLAWLDERPDNRAQYDDLSPDERAEFVREKSHELWIEHLNAQRQKRLSPPRARSKP